MRALPAGSERAQSPGEEIAISVSHGLALAVALAGIPFLIVRAARQGDAGFIVGASVLSATIILLYLGSTLYHALQAGRAKRVFRVIEHSAIFLLIAGTYTPFTLGVLRGVWGWSLFGVVWGASRRRRGDEDVFADPTPHFFHRALFADGMGRGLCRQAADRDGADGGPHLVAGRRLVLHGGRGFFATDSRLRYGHFVWHLFVMAGTACHFLAVYWYAAGA